MDMSPQRMCNLKPLSRFLQGKHISPSHNAHPKTYRPILPRTVSTTPVIRELPRQSTSHLSTKSNVRADVIKKQTLVAASKGVSRRSRRNNEATRYTCAETTPNVVTLAPSKVTIAKLCDHRSEPARVRRSRSDNIRFRWTSLFSWHSVEFGYALRRNIAPMDGNNVVTRDCSSPPESR
jgi:hypothetical protein